MSTLSITNKARQQVLGYPVDVVSLDLALQCVEADWQRQKSMHVVTINAEMVVAAQQDAELDRIIRHAHLIVPDGAGVVWAIRLNGGAVERLPGIELAYAVLERARTLGKRVALLGGRPEILEQLQEKLGKELPGLNIVAAHDGYFTRDEEEEIVAGITAQQPDLLLVALGVPKQEYFVDRWAAAFPHTVFIGVGGSFDVWAGNVKRAPLIMRRLHLEWLYRLMKEPWRWRRMMAALPKFCFQVLQDIASGKNNRTKRRIERHQASLTAQNEEKSDQQMD